MSLNRVRKRDDNQQPAGQRQLHYSTVLGRNRINRSSLGSSTIFKSVKGSWDQKVWEPLLYITLTKRCTKDAWTQSEHRKLGTWSPDILAFRRSAGWRLKQGGRHQDWGGSDPRSGKAGGAGPWPGAGAAGKPGLNSRGTWRLQNLLRSACWPSRPGLLWATVLEQQEAGSLKNALNGDLSGRQRTKPDGLDMSLGANPETNQ